jgi:hypothetical protein
MPKSMPIEAVADHQTQARRVVRENSSADTTTNARRWTKSRWAGAHPTKIPGLRRVGSSPPCEAHQPTVRPYANLATAYGGLKRTAPT